MGAAATPPSLAAFPPPPPPAARAAPLSLGLLVSSAPQTAPPKPGRRPPDHLPPAPPRSGISLFTVHVRRGDPSVQDPGLNSHSKLNCIAACLQAAAAGADEALMLDPQGFVATCNRHGARGGRVCCGQGFGEGCALRAA